MKETTSVQAGGLSFAIFICECYGEGRYMKLKAFAFAKLRWTKQKPIRSLEQKAHLFASTI